MKICPEGAELFHVDRQTDMIKSIVASPKNLRTRLIIEERLQLNKREIAANPKTLY
jgi:hypothetical protein